MEGIVTPEFLASLPFFLLGEQHVISISNDQHQKIKAIFKLMQDFEKEREVVMGITFSLLVYIKKLSEAEVLASKYHLSIKEQQVRKFRSLIAKHFREEKQVRFYADKMNTTPKYLGEFLLSETGKSAKCIINDVIFLEAKSLLKQIAMSVQEISLHLSFANSSYFSKAFKKYVGVAPLTYRKKQLHSEYWELPS
ncbi:helix-turn-helix domain-containing protein [Galbibacter sp. CMA-7]|uniref:Helix-turn-helix domain-containing protein n=1 Tax=Galbibacter pacificus TaxID=2996052 RepID=A0ABT6FNM6_9FLAO|nr:helix-turn-helix domain-containing protein [Galbibacter pacificus]MDG3581389.1 helix-turn-helix domain-containing protein [Galbibacter pacificus]MDG3584867.1 helix-turn-helix domain-containing protein [Galbibacter pacificus]